MSWGIEKKTNSVRVNVQE